MQSASTSANATKRLARPHRTIERYGLGRGDGFEVVQRGGLALWSRRRGSGYRLVTRRAGKRARVLGVAASPFPFDADLGSDAEGHTVATYSRCAVGRGPGDLAIRTHCRLRLLDLRTDREGPLGPDRPDVDRVRPALHDGVLAYAELSRGTASIRLLRLDTARRPRTVISLALRDPGDVLGVDHEAQGLAFAVRDQTDPGFTRLYLKRPGQRLQVIGTGGFGEENARFLTSPSGSTV